MLVTNRGSDFRLHQRSLVNIDFELVYIRTLIESRFNLEPRKRPIVLASQLSFRMRTDPKQQGGLDNQNEVLHRVAAILRIPVYGTILAVLPRVATIFEIHKAAEFDDGHGEHGDDLLGLAAVAEFQDFLSGAFVVHVEERFFFHFGCYRPLACDIFHDTVYEKIIFFFADYAGRTIRGWYSLTPIGIIHCCLVIPLAGSTRGIPGGTGCQCTIICSSSCSISPSPFLQQP
mmetsp:Transcript_31111/g.67302  ORF Transcript_31111/g.67302 Transcript_31111/m.67302 type:complete len:231 (-) Transcript_31111:8-700(-)